MKSRATGDFWFLYAALPLDVQRAARRAFAQFESDPFHPSLRFKEVNKRVHLWSARVSRDYRALGIRNGEQMTWTWIGSHADYDKLLTGR